MKAMVLAAGSGTRLQPLTDHLPKPMAPVANEPVMAHLLRLLARHGFDEIIVNLYHLPEAITDHFRDGRAYGVHLTYTREEKLWGIAGAVKRVEDFFGDETFLVIGGDDLCDFDLSELLRRHRDNRALATIALYEVEDPSLYGIVAVSEEGRVQRFLEKPPPEQAFSRLANTQVYLFEPRILEPMPGGVVLDFGRQVFPALVEQGERFFGFPMTGYWKDVGNFREYLQANLDFISGRVGLPLSGEETSPGVRVASSAKIESSSRLEPPVLVGENCLIERSAKVHASCLGPGSRIGAGSEVSRCVVWPGAQVAPGARLEGRIVTPLVTV